MGMELMPPAVHLTEPSQLREILPLSLGLLVIIFWLPMVELSKPIEAISRNAKVVKLPLR
jgi:hypothetical protein